MEFILSPDGVDQPDVYKPVIKELHVAIASLSLGGAERIVLDWAERIHPRFRVHLIVLRDREKEWKVPWFVRVTRLGGVHLTSRLEAIGKMLSEDVNPVCVCHLLNEKERNALGKAGAVIVPVLHNARSGWVDSVEQLLSSPYIIAVSDACAKDLREDGWGKTTSVIRHIPPAREYLPDVRREMRRAWNIPENAVVVGMLGALKPQKNYPLALRVFKEFLKKQDAYLAIIGGPVNTSVGLQTWHEVVREIDELGIRERVAMPGFIPDAAQLLPACDVILNTSHFEGMSIATLEALLARVPVVASEVGGQGEVAHDSLVLVPPESNESLWADALEKSLKVECKEPEWAGFPSYRLWTLAGMARPVERSAKTLFVTANLSSGGAQRSLVNLATGLQGRMPFEIIVAGRSSIPYFVRELHKAGVRVMNAGTRWNVFDYAENITDKIIQEGFGTVCFWNADPRLKLLLVKSLAFTGIRFVEVSPGGHAFEEMAETSLFQRMIAFSEEDYLRRIDVLVHKYHAGPLPGCEGKTLTIRNGVRECLSPKMDYLIHGSPRVVVSGRIAPTKFVVEIVSAVRMLRDSIPDLELHIIGGVEHYMEEYHKALMESVGNDTRVIFHGPRTDVLEILPEFDAYVVLGKHQGCPNALLEALSAGLPVIGNDDGGTREQIIDGETGLLISDIEPQLIAEALKRVILDRDFAQKIGTTGREYVRKTFSMKAMVDNYEALLMGASNP